MKNLLIYTGADKKFSKEDEILVRIQIDNSLELGWEKENIILITDFPYSYKIRDNIYYPFDKNANKVPVICYLVENGMIDEKEIYWCHDLDAYELNRIEEEELELDEFDLGLTHYTYKPEWQCGSFFFKKSAYDIFKLIDKTTLEKPHLSRNNEKTLTKLIKANKIEAKRYKRMDVRYNIMKKYLDKIYPLADKPLKVLHFRPSDTDSSLPQGTLNVFMYGQNALNLRIMNDRLIKIFNQNGIN
jgi:hypothetical protein